MASTKPTKISFLKKLYLIIIAFFSPEKFIKEQDKDTKLLESLPKEENKASIYNIRQAFFFSFFLILLSGSFGVGIGLSLGYLIGPAKQIHLLIIQIICAITILWATLAVRGWDIQTFCGVTLTERVNQWIYRSLYFLGTVLLIMSLVWQTE